jgi:pimeloyl-ACP methyl ester carboxylesterase
VADARPERVVRVIYVDSIPPGSGDSVNTELPRVDAEIPLPDWSAFSHEDLRDMSDDVRASFRDIAIPVPGRVATDPLELHDPRRYDVPVTIITCEFTSDQLRARIAEWHSWVAELAGVRDVTYVDVPTGHWPYFTKAARLTDALLSDLR